MALNWVILALISAHAHAGFAIFTIATLGLFFLVMYVVINCSYSYSSTHNKLGLVCSLFMCIIIILLTLIVNVHDHTIDRLTRQRDGQEYDADVKLLYGFRQGMWSTPTARRCWTAALVMAACARESNVRECQDEHRDLSGWLCFVSADTYSHVCAKHGGLGFLLHACACARAHVH